MYLITVKHAGVVMEVIATIHPDIWHETEGKAWRARYSSAVITTQYLGTDEETEQPKKRGTK